MKMLTETIFSLLMKVKVMHSLPGRMRISLPQIKKIPEEFRHEQDLIELLLLVLPGIERVTVNYLLGTVLIAYESRLTSEKIILTYIKKALTLLNRFQERLSKLSPHQLQEEIKTIGLMAKQEIEEK